MIQACAHPRSFTSNPALNLNNRPPRDAQNLWAALRSMDTEQQRGFLRFVTSCGRPPLLGFKHLEPRLCVQVRYKCESRRTRLQGPIPKTL